MNDKINKACCFSGHRPNKFKFGYNEKDERCIKIKELLKSEILKVIKDDNIRTFYVGMAQGVDIWAAEILLDLKTIYNDIKLVAVVPFAGQPDRWDTDYQKRYLDILTKIGLENIVCISLEYTNRCMQNRNKYMINRSNILIAVSNGSIGGTLNAINYAKTKNLDIRIINAE